MIQNSATYNDVWQDCLARIRKQTSDEEFAKWFQPIVPIGFDGQTLRLRLPSEECVYHIEHNYIPSLRPIIYELFGDKTRLRYSVPQAGQAAPQGYTHNSIAKLQKVYKYAHPTAKVKKD